MGGTGSLNEDKKGGAQEDENQNESDRINA